MAKLHDVLGLPGRSIWGWRVVIVLADSSTCTAIPAPAINGRCIVLSENAL